MEKAAAKNPQYKIAENMAFCQYIVSIISV